MDRGVLSLKDENLLHIQQRYTFRGNPSPNQRHVTHSNTLRTWLLKGTFLTRYRSLICPSDTLFRNQSDMKFLKVGEVRFVRTCCCSFSVNSSDAMNVSDIWDLHSNQRGTVSTSLALQRWVTFKRSQVCVSDCVACGSCFSMNFFFVLIKFSTRVLITDVISYESSKPDFAAHTTFFSHRQKADLESP